MPSYEHLTKWDELAAQQANVDATGPDAIYRGQADARWGLKPSLTRLLNAAGLTDPDDPAQVAKAVSAEEEAMRVFQIAHPMSADLRHWIVWWAVAQHFSGATRALDWSQDLGVAVYFAVSSEPSSDAALFVLRQKHLHAGADPLLREVYNADLTDHGWTRFHEIFRSGNPVAMHVCTTFGTPARLQMQQGFVTSCSNILRDHGNVIEAKYPKDTLTKYIIPRASKAALLEEATTRRYSGAALFSDSTERAGYAQRDALMRHLGR